MVSLNRGVNRHVPIRGFHDLAGDIFGRAADGCSNHRMIGDRWTGDYRGTDPLCYLPRVCNHKTRGSSLEDRQQVGHDERRVLGSHSRTSRSCFAVLDHDRMSGHPHGV